MAEAPKRILAWHWHSHQHWLRRRAVDEAMVSRRNSSTDIPYVRADIADEHMLPERSKRSRCKP